MADYKVGTRGTLRITDDGTTVRFYVLCSDPATNINFYRWYGTVNGVSVGGTVDLDAGFGSRLLGSWTVTSTQTVTLGQQATGTQGLGGAASFSVKITRATKPPAPTPIGVDEITPTSARYRFQSAGNGGSAITSWQAQIATDAAFTKNVQTVTSSGTTTFSNLTPATKYYFRSRGQNAVGWGSWSSVISATTDSGAYVSQNGKWVPVPAYVSNGSSWIVPELLISDGTTWEAAS